MCIRDRGSLEDRIVGITHVHCLADAQHLEHLIAERYSPEAIWISDMSATIGTYACLLYTSAVAP